MLAGTHTTRVRMRETQRERDVVETYVSSISSAIPDSSFSIPGKQSSAVMPLMNVSSSLTVGGCDRASNRPVVDVLDAQYLRAGHKTLVNPGCPQPMSQLDKKQRKGTNFSNVNGSGFTGEAPLYTMAFPGTGTCTVPRSDSSRAHSRSEHQSAPC